MSIQHMTNQLQQPNFIPVQRDIRIRVKLDIDQANEVVNFLLAAHPVLAEMRQARQLQFINDRKVGLFRMVAVNGGQLPAELTNADVQALVDAVKAEMPDAPAGEPVWYTRQRMAHGRRGGR